MLNEKPFAMFFNASPRKDWNTAKALAVVFGASETLYICDTYQFTDYFRYDVTAVREEDKRLRRDTHFAIDMANARALGKRLVERARTHI